MFTGLIKTLGELKEKNNTGKIIALTIENKELINDGLKTGDSVAVNGLCLTVTGIHENRFVVQAVYETMEKSTIGKWYTGQLLNLERPLTMQSFLDGHLVTGHVDGVANILKIESIGEAKKVTLMIPKALNKYIAEKGSITLDGISLTIAAKPAINQCSVAVIPHTYNNSIAKNWKIGDSVHLEVDIIARYLEQLQHGTEKIDLDFLSKHGF